MKKNPHLLIFSFVALFNVNSFATSTPLDLQSSNAFPNKKPTINPTTETINPIVEKPLIVINSSENTQENHAPLNIAVASNFKVTAQHIGEQFSNAFGIQVNISSASTATLYKQILHGAPFDLFLSADEKHIQLLIEQDRVNQQTGFVYAQGKLVFWQPKKKQALSLDDFMQYDGKLAIANSKFAPYGIAAQEALDTISKWEPQKYVKGNNINQTYQFVESGNVPAGLVSYATVVQKQNKSYVIIPQKWYQPIQQIGIILNQNRLDETDLFREFLLSDSIQLYINSQGYN